MDRAITSCRSTLVASLCLVSVAFAGDDEGLPFPDIASPEIWIDGPTSVQPGNDRRFPDVAVDELGRRIHVWSAFGEVERGDIFLRRFDAEGNPLEDPKLVNTTTEDDQTNPRIAVSADGSFLVIFQSDEFDAVAGTFRRAVRSQLFDANGDPDGPEQLLSTGRTNSSTDLYADVAALRASGGSGGGYAVVWESYISVGSDTGLSIQGCLVSETGIPGAQFQVNSNDAPLQDHPSVTELTDGGFLATWTESSQVVGKRFNAAGGQVGNELVISTSFVSQKVANDAAIGWDGVVAVVWADAEGDGGVNQREIYARLYNADLTPNGPDFRVNTLITDEQREPRVADYGPKGFLVVWESDVSSGADLRASIEARLVSGSNQFGSDQVQFNIWDGDNFQNTPAAGGWYGRLGTSWRTLSRGGDPPPVPNTDDHIFGRDIEDCMFCDDFEWFDPGGAGNLWRWSNTQGVAGQNP